MGDWRSNSHSKFLLQYHLILVCKYRNCFMTQNIANQIKIYSQEIASKHNVVIHCMESDYNHIHYMIETTPNINLSQFVKTLKSYTTYHILQDYGDILKKFLWYNDKRTFWTDGYFIASIGNVSQEKLKDYIKNQGKKS